MGDLHLLNLALAGLGISAAAAVALALAIIGVAALVLRSQAKFAAPALVVSESTGRAATEAASSPNGTRRAA